VTARAVFVDIGGVLELTPATGWQARWEASLGLPAGAIDERLADVWRDGMVGHITEAEAESAMATRLGLDAAALARLLADSWDEYLGSPNQPLIDWFGALRPRVRTGIISNSFVGARAREEARYGFAARCDLLVYSHEVGLAKPGHAIYALACSRLEVSPAEALFLDDVAENVAAAAALGMRAVLYRDAQSAIAELDSYL
jgi:HAD superfamily hydrolase (TIGR01509 family)